SFYLSHRPPAAPSLSLHDALPILRVQVTRAAADGPGGEPDRPGDEHPGGRDHLAGPADQDHDRIAGRGTLGGTTALRPLTLRGADRKSTRLNSSHRTISYAVFCLK